MPKNLTKEQFYQNKISWKKSFLDNFSQDENGDAVPWMTYPAIEFLKNTITKNHEIFEFGCGASTLFFARNAKKVVGLETNEVWLKIVQNFLQREGLENAKINLMADGLTNANYENFAKNSGQKFDLIVIDSLKRFDCAKNVIEALKPQGMVILDDSERKNYAKIFKFFADAKFKQRDFFGIAPGQLRVKNTTVFF
ncbi:MAG: methyltransferase domain-containing protein [Rickettsiales bacterium]|nr:methyltransferase domain-containing protein [Rickettsiales bacterium]